MAHAVFALSPDHRDCMQALLAAGFRPDEISVMPASPDATRTGAPALPAHGVLSALVRGATSLAHSLTAIGVPLWAAHRFETALIGGVALIAVHTVNAYELDTIAAVLRERGCEHVVACATVSALANTNETTLLNAAMPLTTATDVDAPIASMRVAARAA